MKRFRNLFGPPGEKGSITPIVALGLLAFIGFMALSIDLGQLYVVRNELQNVADGAALAAAKQLIREDPANPGKAKIYYDDAVNAAIDCAKKNYSMGADGGINIASSDVVAGKWNLQAKQFDSIAAAGRQPARICQRASGRWSRRQFQSHHLFRQRPGVKLPTGC